jgi:hypothetical protein
MHTTTVRFDEQHWQQLGIEAARAGVSKAQYIRDATIARIAVAVLLPEVLRLRRDYDQLRQHIAEGWRP